MGWLGMTMQHAWPFLMNTLYPISVSERRVKVRIELAMLVPRDDVNNLNPHWPSRAKANYDAILKFKETYKDQLNTLFTKVDFHVGKILPGSGYM